MTNVSLNFVSSNIIGTAQNIFTKDGSIDASIFGDILSNTQGSIFQDINILENTESDEELNINYEMLLSLLITLRNQENVDFSQISEDLQVNLDEVLSNENLNNINLNDLFNNSEDLLGDFSLENILTELGEESEGLIEVLDLLSEKENLDKLTDFLKNNGISEEDLLSLQDITKEDKFNELEGIAKNDFANYNKNINSEVSDLSLNGMLNKGNIIESESKSEDLSILENIADGGEFSFQTNVVVENNNIPEETNAPASTIRQSFVEEDTIKTIRFMTSNGIEEMKIKISPQELGEMSIKLIKENDVATVFIEVTNEDAYELVNKGLLDIIKHLDDSKIDIKDVVVSINKDDKHLSQDSFNNEFERKQHQEQNKKNNYKSEGIEFEDIQSFQIEEDNLNILI